MPTSRQNAKLGLIQEHIDRILGPNLTRVSRLVAAYETLRGSGRGRRSVCKLDILRAAIVLLHASLEDFLRSLAAVFLPAAEEEVLNSVPLVGTERSGRPEKFLLGKLAAHRGKTVDDVIKESVEQHLEYSNYNNASDIAALLGKIGVRVDAVESTFANLEKIIKRRHQIVHRADRVQSSGSGHHYARSINPNQVRSWVGVTKDFMTKVLNEIKDTGTLYPLSDNSSHVI